MTRKDLLLLIVHALVLLSIAQTDAQVILGRLATELQLDNSKCTAFFREKLTFLLNDVNSTSFSREVMALDEDTDITFYNVTSLSASHNVSDVVQTVTKDSLKITWSVTPFVPAGTTIQFLIGYKATAVRFVGSEKGVNEHNTMTVSWDAVGKTTDFPVALVDMIILWPSTFTAQMLTYVQTEPPAILLNQTFVMFPSTAVAAGAGRKVQVWFPTLPDHQRCTFENAKHNRADSLIVIGIIILLMLLFCFIPCVAGNALYVFCYGGWGFRQAKRPPCV